MIKCNLTGQECFQHTGFQCRGESEDCYWKEEMNDEKYAYDEKDNIVLIDGERE